MSRAGIEKISGPAGGSKGLESRCQIRLNRFRLNTRNNRATIRSSDITWHPHFYTSTFHEDDNLIGTFLTRLSYFTFKKDTFLNVLETDFFKTQLPILAIYPLFSFFYYRLFMPMLHYPFFSQFRPWPCTTFTKNQMTPLYQQT